MTDTYFTKFPTINYNNSNAINITERTTLLNSVYRDPLLYYQYNVKPGERPDNIADRYYQDQYSSWLLYMSNKIVDPYYQWPLDNDAFNEFIAAKYGSLQSAQRKIKYYRNNWYDYTTPISINDYNNFSIPLQTYYQPVYSDIYTSTSPINYIRTPIDTSVTTNSIATYNVANGNNFINNEVIKIYFDVNNVGTGQVCFSNSSIVNIQHLSGITTTGTISGLSYLYGNESETNTIFTTAMSVVNTISAAEITYWSAVTYYDYENEINESNKSIKILNSRYSTKISDQLQKLLSE